MTRTSLFTCSQPFFCGRGRGLSHVWFRPIRGNEIRSHSHRHKSSGFYCAPGRTNYLQSGMEAKASWNHRLGPITGLHLVDAWGEMRSKGSCTAEAEITEATADPSTRSARSGITAREGSRRRGIPANLSIMFCFARPWVSSSLVPPRSPQSMPHPWAWCRGQNGPPLPRCG
jgi:hypothetical protein